MSKIQAVYGGKFLIRLGCFYSPIINDEKLTFKMWKKLALVQQQVNIFFR